MGWGEGRVLVEKKFNNGGKKRLAVFVSPGLI